MGKKGIVIGIDPDATASGVAVVDAWNETMSCHTLPFAEAVSYIKNIASRSAYPVKVYVEAGWMNTGNWHITTKDSKAKCAAMGVSVGRNQETGRKIIEMLTYFGIPCTGVKPLTKCWSGKDRKITHEELVQLTGFSAKRSNQEERDAALIAWTYSDLPFRPIKIGHASRQTRQKD